MRDTGFHFRCSSQKIVSSFVTKNIELSVTESFIEKHEEVEKVNFH